MKNLGWQRLLGEIEDAGIVDPRVTDAFAHVDRALFVPAEFEEQDFRIYQDEPLPIPHGLVTTQPSLIAKMLEGLRLQGSEKVLEIGTGLGFQTALLARLCREVCSIELYEDLTRQASRNLASARLRNVRLRTGDGRLGWREEAPFDAIIVSAAALEVPDSLIEQLTEGGRLVQPIGPGGHEVVTVFRKYEGMLMEVGRLTYANFVKLRKSA